ncbi:DUF2752 domain-containing protein [Maribacter confluentis]|uniref:DUF2752 domain-containing protein n=1 Tax=Maribacter confluentis TaxID=1656093 RepID=A0ABT8RVG6_9FLAO|nr:DUF2752 domain-containing protein [Maribacter confluentis]MDO1514815.1 DUF2752 domain-containing protein [Maribacter confluentis]
MQRAILFLTKGEFIEAFKMYPAIYPMLYLHRVQTMGIYQSPKFIEISSDNG